MSTERQRDAETDRLLRAALRPDVHAEACPNADMLAAYTEATLSAAERDRLDTHFADCHRCQEALGLISRTSAEPVSDPARPSLAAGWWSLPMRWLVPLAAAAIVVMYVAVRPVIAPYFPASGAPSSQADHAVPTQTMADARQQDRGAFAPEEKAVGGATSSTERPKGKDTPGSALPSKPGANGARRSTLQPPDRTTAMPAGEILSPAAGAPRGGAAQAEVRPDLARPTPPAVSATADPSAGIATKMAIRQLGLKAAESVALPEAASPDGGAVWAFASGGRIWRSTDRRTTWEPQTSGVTTDLLAGSAPSSSVCWIVGRDATVIVTADGTRWEVRPFPERIDLVGVEAADARTAMVTASDARRFVTADGGVTWAQKRK